MDAREEDESGGLAMGSSFSFASLSWFLLVLLFSFPESPPESPPVLSVRFQRDSSCVLPRLRPPAVQPPRVVQPIKMEVGIEEFLHIEFEYDRDAFHLHDVVTGKVYFLLVRINIMHMDVSVLRRETTRTPSGVFTETDTLLKFEVMDGAPVAGEVIPIRLFLTSLDLTPTYEDVDGTYDVRYYLNLVLVDDEERRYFKQSEIRLFRSPVDRPVLLLTDGSDATSRGVGSGPARPTPAAATGGGGGSGGSGAGAPASLPPPPPPSSATPLFGTSASTASSAMKGTGSADDWL